MKAQTKENQDAITPQKAIELLKEGNKRFVQNDKANRDLIEQVEDTKNGQYPFAVILSCIDSRVPVELVFDQGIGDIFSVRVAGNIVNEDVLGSIEYGCKVAGAKIVMVMGHSKCGAVNAACNNVRLGNITVLLEKIKPAKNIVTVKNGKMDYSLIEDVAIQNVKTSIAQIREESPILEEMEQNGEIEIVGAMYLVETGRVNFMEL